MVLIHNSFSKNQLQFHLAAENSDRFLFQIQNFHVIQLNKIRDEKNQEKQIKTFFELHENEFQTENISYVELVLEYINEDRN